MVRKILIWTALLLAFKLTLVLLVGKLDVDPRRDIVTREKLRQAFKPNTVFVGTSRTLYGINPAIFDSLNAGKTRSYNLGMFSLSFANSLKIADNLIQNSPETETIFIELSALDYSTIHLTPAAFFDDLYFRLRVNLAAGEVNDHEKWNELLLGSNTTLFQILSIAPQIATIKKHINPGNDPVEGAPKLEENGFQRVILRLLDLNTVIINNRFYSRKLITIEKILAPNHYFLSKIQETITTAKSRKKQIIFYLPNNITKGEFDMLSHVAPYIPEANFIRLPKDSSLDVIFKPENLFDAHHLNANGSAIYTRYLQEQFIKKQAH